MEDATIGEYQTSRVSHVLIHYLNSAKISPLYHLIWKIATPCFSLKHLFPPSILMKKICFILIIGKKVLDEEKFL